MEKKLKEEKTNIELTQEQVTKKRMKRSISIFLIILSASLFIMTIIFTNDRINEAYNTIKYVPLCAIANLCLAALVCIRNIKK